MENHKKLKVAAYCRVSTDKDDQTNSLISQRKYFADYITRHDDWALKDVYYDEGISGTQTKKRAGFNAMIEEALKGGIDLILTKEVCRFARNTVDTLSYTRRLKDHGVGVVFTIDNIDTRDSDGELRLTIMASIAQEESRKTSERVKWGQKRRMEQGIVFGRDLLGYTVCNGRLRINEEEAPIVRAIFHKYTNEGKGSHVIARELSEEGLHPKRGTFWSSGVILKVLKNEKYAGDLCQKKTFTPNYLTHAKKCNRGEEKTVYLKDHHEPIIDRDLWNRTREVLLRRSPAAEQKNKLSNRYWCSGKLCCGICGQHYVSRTKKLKSGAVYKAWRCYAAAGRGMRKTSDNGEIIGCSNCSINERALLSCMQYCICQLQIDQKELKQEILQEIKTVKRSLDKKPDAKQIQKKIDSLYAKKRKAVDLMLDGLISKADLQEQTKWYEEQAARLSAMLSHSPNGDNAKDIQLNTPEPYAAVLDEILSFEGSNECLRHDSRYDLCHGLYHDFCPSLYREVLDKIIICSGNTVIIYLKDIPFGIKLTFRSHGRQEDYTTEILSVVILAMEIL